METEHKQILVLSIQQPWAWLIVQGFKDIENRRWNTKYRGQFLVHAGKKIDPDWTDLYTRSLKSRFGIELPPLDQLPRGGIVGISTIEDCLTASSSPWFGGPFGFKLRDSRPLPFLACRGALGFFKPPQEAAGIEQEYRVA